MSNPYNNQRVYNAPPSAYNGQQAGNFPPPGPTQPGFAPPTQSAGYAPPMQSSGYAPPGAINSGFMPPSQNAAPQNTGYAPPSSQSSGYAPPPSQSYMQSSHGAPSQNYYGQPASSNLGPPGNVNYAAPATNTTYAPPQGAYAQPPSTMGYGAPPPSQPSPAMSQPSLRSAPPQGQFTSGPPSSSSTASSIPPPKSNVQFFSMAGGAPKPVQATSSGPPGSMGGAQPFGGPPMTGPPSFSGPPVPNPMGAPPPAMSQAPPSYPPPGPMSGNAMVGDTAPGIVPGMPPSVGPMFQAHSQQQQQNPMSAVPSGFDGSYTPYGAQNVPNQNFPGGAIASDGVQLPTLEEMDLSIQCDPSFLRSTTSKVLGSQNSANQTRVPLGVVCRPMAGDVGVENSGVEVVDFGATGIVRCKRCRTYINPFVAWLDNGRKWRCNICGMISEVPNSYFSHLDQNGQRRDKHSRPELSRCSVEFVAPGDYMVRPPQPPVYFFVIDVTASAAPSGMIQCMVNAIKKSLDSLPGLPRTQVGFITFDTSVHFYNLKSTLKSPQMLVLSDITDVIMPSPEDLLVNLQDSRAVVDALLDSLPTMFQNNSAISSCMGSAVMAARQIMANIGGKLLLFQTSLPTIGEGSLKPRENPRVIGTDKEHLLLNAEDLWYKNNALEFSRLQISVDIFLFSNQYTDVANFNVLTKTTSGSTYFYPGFYGVRDGEKFESDLHHNLTRATAFEAVMRIRATKGLRIVNFFGNFFLRGTDLLSLPTCHSDSVFGMDLAYDEPVLGASVITVQAALLYTSSMGERRIRVHTMIMPVVHSIPDFLSCVDIDCTVNIIAKQAVDVALQNGLEGARQRIHTSCVEMLRSTKSTAGHGHGHGGNQYGQFNQPQAAASVASVPASLMLLPLYAMSLQKNLSVRGGTDVRTDERAFFHNLICNMDIEESKVFIYPRMFSIHDMSVDAGVPSDNVDDVPTAGLHRIRLPVILNLSHERLVSDGIFLLENGYDLYMWIGRSVNPAILDTLFGVASLDNIDMSTLRIQSNSSDYSHRVNEVIVALRSERNRFLQLHYIREGDGHAEAYFSRFLVEDR